MTYSNGQDFVDSFVYYEQQIYENFFEIKPLVK